jgi:DNA-directed RNA polymerase specialized sigma24 family protein
MVAAMRAGGESSGAEGMVDDLALRVRVGDREAENALVKVLRPLVVRFCRRRMSMETEAEDVAQDALVKFMQAIAIGMTPRRSHLAWLYAVAKFDVLTHRKRALRRRETDGVSLESDIADRLDDGGDWMKSMEAFEALARLNPCDRAVVHDLLARSAEPASARSRKRKQRTLGRLRSAIHQA